MPSNEQKRAAAKRKLQRQLAKRAEHERQRQRLTLVFAAVVVIALIAGGVFWWVKSRPKPDVLSCAFQAAQEPPSKPVTKPVGGPAVTTPATQDVTLQTDQGDIPIALDRTKSPCATQSFLSLAQQGFFNDTTCHRLTTSGIFVLQCGDPTGTGKGGPGYSFANEYPTSKNKPVATTGATFYTRGTLAMANAGPDTNGSQFFLVYKDSALPPDYTVFGHIAEPGLAVLDKIAAGGVDSPAGDGAPKIPVKIVSVALFGAAASSQPPAPQAPAAPAQPAPAGR